MCVWLLFSLGKFNAAIFHRFLYSFVVAIWGLCESFNYNIVKPIVTWAAIKACRKALFVWKDWNEFCAAEITKTNERQSVRRQEKKVPRVRVHLTSIGSNLSTELFYVISCSKWRHNSYFMKAPPKNKSRDDDDEMSFLHTDISFRRLPLEYFGN